MTSLALIIYCLIRVFFLYQKTQYIKAIIQILKCIGLYILGLCLSAPILIPSLAAFLNSSRESLGITSILFNIHNWLPDKTMILKYLAGFRCSSSNTYWAEIPFMEAIILFITLFFHKSKRNIQCILVLLTGSILWCLPITSYIASGFGNPYTRWIFILQFAYTVIFITTFQEILACRHFEYSGSR